MWLLFIIFLLIVFGALGSNTSGRRSQYGRTSNRRPVLTAKALVISKRQEPYTQYGRRGAAYFVTFEDRQRLTREFEVSDVEYRTLNPGDYGELTFSGNEMISYQRDIVGGNA